MFETRVEYIISRSK